MATHKTRPFKTRPLIAGFAIGLLLHVPPVAGQESDTPQPTSYADASAIPTNTSDLFSTDESAEDFDVLYHQSRMTVPVSIDGQGPYRFLVDTGSETTVVSRQLATELGILPSGQARLVGSIRAMGVQTVHLNALSIGKQTMEDLPAVLLDANHVGAAGILGIDTLRGHRVIFDFANEAITITPAGRRARNDDEFEIVVRAKRKQDRMVISDAEIDGIPVHLVIDTGSNHSVGNSALRRKLREGSYLGIAGMLDVTGARLESDVMMIRKMTFGNLTLANSGLIINDSPAFAELGLTGKPAVLLGMNHLAAFSRMSVDFSRREIAFDLAD